MRGLREILASLLLLVVGGFAMLLGELAVLAPLILLVWALSRWVLTPLLGWPELGLLGSAIGALGVSFLIFGIRVVGGIIALGLDRGGR